MDWERGSTTMAEIAVDTKLCTFIEEYADDPYCWEIFLFLAKHPRTRFSQQAIVRALNTRTVYIERALSRLIHDGVVTRYIENQASFYLLTGGESLLSTAPGLVKLDLYRWRLLHQQTDSTSVG